LIISHYSSVVLTLLKELNGVKFAKPPNYHHLHKPGMIFPDLQNNSMPIVAFSLNTVQGQMICIKKSANRQPPEIKNRGDSSPRPGTAPSAAQQFDALYRTI
jgi:hypothetical protein